MTSRNPKLTFDWAREAGEFENLQAVLAQKVSKKKQRRARVKGAAVGLVVLLAISLWAIPTIRQTDTIATIAAHRQSVTLDDGSAVDLNARTELKTDFRYGRRVVRLGRGEAYFAVAKDSAHPFFVETPTGTVRVTGTHFNVRVNVSGGAEVTLLEGKVLIERDNAPAIALVPGEQLAAGQSVPKTLSPTQLENAISWRTGQLAFTGLTLAEAVDRFAAYHDRSITLAPELAHLRPGGSASLDDLPGFLDFLRQAFPVTVLPQADGSYRVVGR